MPQARAMASPIPASPPYPFAKRVWPDRVSDSARVEGIEPTYLVYCRRRMSMSTGGKPCDRFRRCQGSSCLLLSKRPIRILRKQCAEFSLETFLAPPKRLKTPPAWLVRTSHAPKPPEAADSSSMRKKPCFLAVKSLVLTEKGLAGGPLLQLVIESLVICLQQGGKKELSRSAPCTTHELLK